MSIQPASLASAFQPLAHLYHHLFRYYHGLRNLAVSRRFALATFAFPLILRMIPDILAGPYPIGYDSISSYIPLMRVWPSGNSVGQFHPEIGGWVVFALFGLAYATTRLDPTIIVKIAGPILYGILGVSQFEFAKKTMKWSDDKSALLVFVSAIYFVSLRVSWDLFRNTLGIALMLLTLAFAKDARSTRGLLSLSMMTMIVASVHLLAATLLVALIAFEFVSRRRFDLRRLSFLLPAGAYCIVSLVELQNQGLTVLTDNNPSVQPLSAYLFPLYIFLPLLPMAVIGARKFLPALVRNWILVCSLGVLAATTPLAVSTAIVSPDRWSLMMFPPMLVLSVEGYSRLRHSAPRLSSGKSLAATLWVILLLVLAVTYIGLQAQDAFPYYHYFGPSTMLQSSIPVQDSSSVASLFQWLSDNSHVSNSVIIAHNAIYGWALQYYSGNTTILGFDPGTTFDTMLTQALQRGYTTLFTVWWANGQGWYGQPIVPQGFLIVHQDGEFGAFMYRI